MRTAQQKAELAVSESLAFHRCSTSPRALVNLGRLWQTMGGMIPNTLPSVSCLLSCQNTAQTPILILKAPLVMVGFTVVRISAFFRFQVVGFLANMSASLGAFWNSVSVGETGEGVG